jgi:dTDP-4-amino-4,6-dideoxygalactose transaminase
MTRGGAMRQSRLRMWPPLPPDVYLRRPTRDPPYPLAAPDCLMLRKARQALFFGIQGLNLQPGEEVILPAYHHGSEVEAFRRTGLGCRFYDVGPTLRPDPVAIEELVGPRTRALYLIHYLGFPQDAPGWLRWCRERKLLLIEDVAQSWLASAGGRPLGSFGDLAIFSFYKSVGVPEGGALRSSQPVEVAVQRRPARTIRVLRQLANRHEAWLTSRSSVAASLRATSTHRWRSSAWTYRLGKVHVAPSRIIPFLLPRLLEPDPAERRRGNYRVLLRELGRQVPEALSVLPDGASPYFFPVQTTDKPGLIALLNEREIDAVDFWSVPHPLLPAAVFPMASRLRASIVGVPVHQELRDRDLERIVAAVRGWGGRPRAPHPRPRAVPPASRLDGRRAGSGHSVGREQ